jgi:hypothetical protein
MNELQEWIIQRQKWKRIRKKQQLERDREDKDREGNGARNGADTIK